MFKVHSNEYGHVGFDNVSIDLNGILKFETLPLIDLSHRNDNYSTKSKEFDIYNCVNVVQSLCTLIEDKEIINGFDFNFKELIELKLEDDASIYEKILVYIWDIRLKII